MFKSCIFYDTIEKQLEMHNQKWLNSINKKGLYQAAAGLFQIAVE